MSFSGEGGGLSNADDVLINSPATDHSLAYDSVPQKWVNKSPVVEEINVTKYGAVAGDRNFDNTAAFRSAISSAISTSKPVYIPPGEYTFTPVAGSIVLPLNTGITMKGAGSSVTTLRIQDAPSVFWHGFIGSNWWTAGGDAYDLSNLTLMDFTFDANTTGNPIDDVTMLKTGVGHGSRTMVMAMKGNDISIREIRAIDCDGIWVTQFGATTTTQFVNHRCNRVNIDIDVLDFGGPLYHDTSTVYVVGDDVKVRGNFTAKDGARSAIAAVELHSSNTDVQVKTDGFYIIANMTGADMDTNRSLNAHGCIGRKVGAAFILWSQNYGGQTDYGLDGVSITDCDIELDPGYWSATDITQPGNYAHVGVGITDRDASTCLPMRNLSITKNRIRVVRSAETSSVSTKTIDAGISLIRKDGVAAGSGPDISIDVSDNMIDSPFTCGVLLDLKNPVVNINCSGNRVHNPVSNGMVGLTAEYAAGVTLKGSFTGLTADDVLVTDDRSPILTTAAVNASGATISQTGEFTNWVS